MLLKDLVAILKHDLNTHAVARNHPDPFIQEESERTAKELVDLFNSLENSAVEITVQSAKPLLDYLAKKRLERIKDHTDAISMHNPHTLANQICWMLGSEVARILGLDVYSILYPSVKIIRNDINLAKNPILKPHEFVLSDDGQYAIEVYACLNNFSKDGDYLKHTVLIDGERKKLSETEKNRVINHCKKAREWYEKIIEDQQFGLKSEATTRMARAFHKQNQKDNFDDEYHPDYKITATYGAESQKNLANKLFTDKEQIVAFMLKHPLNKWDELLNGFDLQDLRKILLNGVPFQTAIADKLGALDNQINVVAKRQNGEQNTQQSWLSYLPWRSN